MGDDGRQNLVESLAQVTLNNLIKDQRPAVFEAVNEAIAVGRSLGPEARWSLGMALWSRALAYQATGSSSLQAGKGLSPSLQAALTDASESWKLFQESGDRWNAGPLIVIGGIELAQNHFKQAEQYYMQALAAFSEASDKGGIMAAADALLKYFVILGDFEQAAHYLILTVRSVYGQGNDYVTGSYLEALGNIVVIRMVLEPGRASLADLRQVILLLGCASTLVQLNYTQPVTIQAFIEDWIRNLQQYPPMPGLTFDPEQIANVQELLGGLLNQLGPLGILEAFNDGKQLPVREALQIGETLLLSIKP